jgi:signal transduction histidine kinase
MNELTELIIGAMVDRVYVFDRDMRYLFVGRQAGEQLVRDPDTLLGLTGQEAGLPPETTDKVERLVQRVFSTAQPSRLEMTHQIMRGEHQRVECCASPIMERNAVKAVVVVSRDISGRPRRGGGPTGPNGPLSRMGDIGSIVDGQPPAAGAIRDQAERRSLKLALLDAVSHDFRSPLSAILMSLRAIADRGRVLSREAMQQLATEALPAAERMNGMIGSLLDLNRLKAERVTPLLEAVSVRDLVHDMLACNSRKLRNRPVMVAIDSAPRELYTDEMLLHTLIGNLLDNAVKYSPPGSPIELGARAEGEAVVLYVADRGEGIAEKYLGRVFEMSFQVPRSDGGPKEGLGLGLFLCRLIAEELGGDIRLDPRPEGGLLASVSLPGCKELR